MKLPWSRVIAIAFVSASIDAAALTPTPPAIPLATPTEECRLLGGFARISDVVVEPAMPAVGDTVVISFTVQVQAYSRGAVRLEGSEALLDGARSSFSGPFEMRAIAAGVASIELAVTYNTEYKCGDIFYPGPDMEERSESVEFEISAATPTATPTVTATVPTPAPACPGDCNGDGAVTINELITAVRASTGEAAIADCSPVDLNADRRITVAEIVRAVRASLDGCQEASHR